MTTVTPSSAVPKRTLNALQRADHKVSDLNDEQRDRAINCERVKAGLTGKALSNWIMTGDSRTESESMPPVAAAEANAEVQHAMVSGSTPSESEPVRVSTDKPKRARTMQLVRDTLTATGRPMHMNAIVAGVLERNAALPANQQTLKGKTPAATITAQVSVNARDGKTVEKVAPNVFALLDWDATTKQQDPVIPDGLRARRDK